MQGKSVELIVGIFVIGAIFGLLVLALNVSGLRFQGDDDTYYLYARFENSSGLSERAKVSLSGVIVGRVVDIRLDTDSYVSVVKMAIEKGVPLSLDTSASILTSGLLGEKYIGLSVGADEENLLSGDVIEDTQSAIVLEELIGQFIFSRASESP
ncbi:outer membrane lipid asymmetry maintenance protein MlaD [Oceaniserpentilla sp. 4NH20-0058]|uniref:outer membrane lipid asymmetry maintenance protein MlaD n=1 Tax=Oceaniserpentilla sp. 4NH20-0058 TaxID=3127660 RepID=UPI003107ADE9